MKRSHSDVPRQSESYLETLEKVKEQYQEYVEVSKLYELTTQKDEEPTYESPSPERPLTTHTFVVK